VSTVQRTRSQERSPLGPGSVEARPVRVEIDTPTLITVSALAWAVANIFHEIVGHAGAAVVLGIPVRAVSTTTASLDWDAIESATQDRIINAAATPVNLLTGALALVALRWLTVKSPPMRYFLWLFAVVSFTMVTWNMVTVPLLGAGDWGEVAEGLSHAGLWTAGVVAAGSVVAVVGYRLPLRLFLPDLGDHPGLRHKVTFVPVATMILVQTLSVLASPFATAPAESNHLLASMVAYVHLIAWAVLVNRGAGPRAARQVHELTMHRSTRWLAVGALVIVVFVAVLGPGLGSLENDPRLDSSMGARAFVAPAASVQI
jgi:hypothetical protein